MKFKDTDFDGMRYKIHGLKELVCEKYPEFDSKVFEDDNELRYIIYMYDTHTPLVKINDIQQRKDEAYKLSGVDVINLHSVPAFLEKVAMFCRIINFRDWTLRLSLEESFYMLTDNMRTPVGDTDPEKKKTAYATLKQCASDASEIDKMIKEIDKRLSHDGKSDILEITLAVNTNDTAMERIVKNKQNFLNGKDPNQ